ncbi:DJ-1 family glyoxalase III [Haliangium sp.]|uniref:DJ-1 family glyoxalase III n=1 Tax=Haliangium sp. TaxID=2663208 RepID=UPI003D0CFDD8
MKTPGSVLVPLLDGFEEIEAVTIIDVLRRAGVEVVVAGVEPGPVRGSHDIELTAEVALSEVDPAPLAMIALPGGMPGAAKLREHPEVQRLIRAVDQREGFVAALCAAPIALAPSGVLAGKLVTSYPGVEDQLTGAEVVTDRVVVDGRVVTSRGPGTALEFALTLVGLLAGADKEAALERAMLVARGGPPRRV